uniref:uncharacterized protein LOC105351960 n=1 Tax=Fragaria vesca subsp. vesca TaxID=101020 RepID=UPI0005C97969|nr:PREDICTED: uncharacterized protein LOC105351960 [Fragaria vesca subsp. vesca]XP_011465944.1 PREDICTED: uncharacterized protein LOC105351960 [Fragaria vesca subsp. vesca]
MAVDDDLSQSEKKMTATEGNVASSSHSPEKTRTASAPAGENKADTAEEAKETPGKLEPSAAEGEDVVSIKKKTRSSAPAGDLLPESMADDELCQSEKKVTTTPLGEGNVVSSHCSSAKTGTGSAPAGETKPETVQEGKGVPGESNLGVAEGDKMISKKVTRTSSTGSAPAGET